MYLPNKYTEWYTQIVTRAKSRSEISGYSEKHHIIPRSIGGSNFKDNLVKLTAREHFICHRLLTRMTVGNELVKMKHAVWRMTVRGATFQDRYYPCSHTYEFLRKQFGSIRRGVVTSAATKQKISNANTGNVAWNKGIPRTSEEKELMSIRRKAIADKVGVWNQGKSHSVDTLNKIKEKAQNRKKYTCTHCSKEVAGTNFFRWHGDNCKLK